MLYLEKMVYIIGVYDDIQLYLQTDSFIQTIKKYVIKNKILLKNHVYFCY